MRLRRSAAAAAALLLLALTPAATAEGKPWLQPGETPGQEIRGPDGGAYVWVPPGEFIMGSDSGFGGEQKPAHTVRITRGFWLGKHEVTNAQYRRFCRETGRQFPANSPHPGNHPVVCVSFHDALAYCEHYGLGLPTEAQWEYAARGPESRRYPWGDEWDEKRCCHYDNRGPGGWAHAVGSFPAGASWCGALDMAGNVYEWCLDYYDEGYYAVSPVDDPPGPAEGARRVVRGGAWVSDAYYCRASTRSSDEPRQAVSYIGFRGIIRPQ